MQAQNAEDDQGYQQGNTASVSDYQRQDGDDYADKRARDQNEGLPGSHAQLAPADLSTRPHPVTLAPFHTRLARNI